MRTLKGCGYKIPDFVAAGFNLRVPYPNLQNYLLPRRQGTRHFPYAPQRRTPFALRNIPDLLRPRFPFHLPQSLSAAEPQPNFPGCFLTPRHEYGRRLATIHTDV